MENKVQIAILDDYQHIVLKMADWPAIEKHADIKHKFILLAIPGNGCRSLSVTEINTATVIIFKFNHHL